MAFQLLSTTPGPEEIYIADFIYIYDIFNEIHANGIQIASMAINMLNELQEGVMSRWFSGIAVVLFLTGALWAGDEALRIRKALKDVGGVEKVVVLQGKEAAFSGKAYDAVVVLTVTTRFASLQGDSLKDFRKEVLAATLRHLKGGNSIIVIQSEKELTYEAWPF
jgi:hypothetical protein